MSVVADRLYRKRAIINAFNLVASGLCAAFGLFWLVWILWTTLRHGIAMAYVLREASAQDTELQVDVRGRRGAVRVTRPPFVDASPK